MKGADSVGIVTLCLAIDLTKREKVHQDHHLRKVEKAERTKMMMAR